MSKTVKKTFRFESDVDYALKVAAFLRGNSQNTFLVDFLREHLVTELGALASLEENRPLVEKAIKQLQEVN